MRESVLRDYFLGLVDEQRLSEDLAGSAVETSYNVITCHITDDFSGDFEVNVNHLIRLCDGFLTDKLKPEHLQLIGFALEASDHFLWDNDSMEDEDTPVAETIHAWSSPEINYPLTVKIIAKFKHLLLTGERTFTKEDVTKQSKKTKN